MPRVPSPSVSLLDLDADAVEHFTDPGLNSLSEQQNSLLPDPMP